MLGPTNVFSSFSVDDIGVARRFYSDVLGGVRAARAADATRG